MRRTASRLTVVSLLLLLACVTTRTVSYLPSPKNPNYTPRQAETALRDFVRLQCAPRKAAQRPDTGSGAYLVEIDTSGLASRAELRRSTNDEMLDGLFGTVAAQLTFANDSAHRALVQARRTTLGVTFHCMGDSAAVSLAFGAPK